MNHQLLCELPDPDQELYIQIDHRLDLTDFTLFGKLPIELRLSIVGSTTCELFI